MRVTRLFAGSPAPVAPLPPQVSPRSVTFSMANSATFSMAIDTAGDRQWLEAVLSGRSVCEGHDPTGELSAGDPHAQFGGQGVETDL